MKNDLTKKIKNVLEEKDGIYIFPSLKRDSVFAALALFYNLENSDQRANLVFGNLPLQHQKFGSESPSFQEPALVIHSPSSKRINRLKYNKKEQRINLFFDTQNNLNLKDFSFHFNYHSPPELFITIGAQTPQDIQHPLFQKEYSHLPVINIDNQKDNKRFGTINVVNEDYSSLCEQLTDLLKELHSEQLNARTGAYLLQGLRLVSNNLDSDRLLQNISYLLEQGSLSHSINPVQVESLAELDMLTKGITNIKVWPHNFFFVDLSFLSNQQFKSRAKTIIKEFHSGLFNFKNLVLLHQNQKKIQGVMYSDNQNILQEIEKKCPAEREDNRVIFHPVTINKEKTQRNLLNIIKKHGRSRKRS